jgi:hypothetical protein
MMSKIDRLTRIVTQNILGKPSATVVYGTARPLESLPVDSIDDAHTEFAKTGDRGTTARTAPVDHNQSRNSARRTCSPLMFYSFDILGN